VVPVTCVEISVSTMPKAFQAPKDLTFLFAPIDFEIKAKKTVQGVMRSIGYSKPEHSSAADAKDENEALNVATSKYLADFNTAYEKKRAKKNRTFARRLILIDLDTGRIIKDLFFPRLVPPSPISRGKASSAH